MYGYLVYTVLVSSAADRIGIRCQKERMLARASETPAVGMYADSSAQDILVAPRKVV